MDLALTDDQQELQRAARRFADERLAEAAQPTDADWATIVDLGWVGMSLPEPQGGSAASLMDVAVVFEELGRVAASATVFDRAVLAPAILAAIGTDAAQLALASALSGEHRIGVVIDARTRLPSDRVTQIDVDPVAGTVRGTARGVSAADALSHCIVLGAGPDGTVGVALVDLRAAGSTTTALRGFVPDHFAIELDTARPVFVDAVRDTSSMHAAIARSTVAQCAYQVGSCQAAYALSLEYSRERKQFGKAIGTFQRVQDHIIELVNATDSARWVTNHAAWVLDDAVPDPLAVHVAKAVTAQAHVTACTSAHEVHAGIGADLQYGLARHTFASRALYARLGDPAWHRGVISEHLRRAQGVPA
jgi:alkylation response protein AidB-like acyl-CoA dehydrogenase